MTQEAQREMEQRALRNVRGLVDKIEGQDKLEGRKERKVLLAILAGAVIVAVAIAIAISLGARKERVVIDPAKLPPVKAGPQR
jgi:hypothetical protein